MRLTDFLNHLHNIKQSGEQWTARCPAHEEKNHNHLYIKQVDDRILVTCQHGCSTESVVAALNLTMADLFVGETAPVVAKQTAGKIVATYDYMDETGKLLFQTVRYEPKDFRQRHKNGSGEWSWDLKGCRRIIYRLPEVLKAETVFVVEGEKDADNLWKAGLPATTSPMGAGKWLPEYASYLKDKDVIVIPDQDKPGLDHGRDIINSLFGIARSCRVILLPCKDVSDWLKGGNEAPSLLGLCQDSEILFASDKIEYRKVQDSIQWTKKVTGKDNTFVLISFRADKLTEERTGIHAVITISSNRTPLSWTLMNIERSEERTRLSNAAAKILQSEIYKDTDLRRDLDMFCSGLWDFHLGTIQPEDIEGDAEIKPIIFLLTPYILQGGGTILFAPPGRGKSYATLLWAVSIDSGIKTFWPVIQSKVLFINLERSRESVARRLAMVNTVLGLPPNRKLLMLNGRGKSLHDVIPACRKVIREKGVKMVFLDSISRAGYGDLNDNRPVNAIMDALSGLCDTWMAIAHTPRADESHIFGGVHFEAAADLVVQLSAETKDSRTLGVGFQITKKNDLPSGLGDATFALEFGEYGLTGFREAGSVEFPDLTAKQSAKKPTLEQIIDYILNSENTEASATEIAQETGLSRKTVFTVLTNDSNFRKLPNKRGREVLYGLSR